MRHEISMNNTVRSTENTDHVNFSIAQAIREQDRGEVTLINQRIQEGFYSDQEYLIISRLIGYPNYCQFIGVTHDERFDFNYIAEHIAQEVMYEERGGNLHTEVLNDPAIRALFDDDQEAILFWLDNFMEFHKEIELQLLTDILERDANATVKAKFSELEDSMTVDEHQKFFFYMLLNKQELNGQELATFNKRLEAARYGFAPAVKKLFKHYNFGFKNNKQTESYIKQEFGMGLSEALK